MRAYPYFHDVAEEIEPEMTYLEGIHRNIENDPSEPYFGVQVLFNGDRFLQGWAPRDEWVIVNPYVIRYLKDERSRNKLDDKGTKLRSGFTNA